MTTFLAPVVFSEFGASFAALLALAIQEGLASPSMTVELSSSL